MNPTRSPTRPHRLTPLHLLVSGGWVAALAIGSLLLWRYEARPGTAGAVPADLPSAVGLAPREQRSFTLLVFIHPRCPCSRATVRELERITARTGAALRTRVLFVRPEGMPEGWERTGLWESVAAIAGVTVVSDPEGREAARFGAQTSGHAVLYDPDGRLVFSGGITSSRGHEGDNAGSDAIVDAVSGKAGPVAVRPDVVTTAVFGCPVCVVTTRPSEPLAERSNR